MRAGNEPGENWGNALPHFFALPRRREVGPGAGGRGDTGGSAGGAAGLAGRSGEPSQGLLPELWRLRWLGPLEDEQVEVGPLLGRGGYGRVFKGALPSASNRVRLCATVYRPLSI